MALSEYAGRLFRVMPERIELFGLMGAHHGASWVVGVPFGETYVPCEVRKYEKAMCGLRV